MICNIFVLLTIYRITHNHKSKINASLPIERASINFLLISINQMFYIDIYRKLISLQNYAYIYEIYLTKNRHPLRFMQSVYPRLRNPRLLTHRKVKQASRNTIKFL